MQTEESRSEKQENPISEALNLQAAHGNWFVKGKAKEGKSGFQGGKGAKKPHRQFCDISESSFFNGFSGNVLWRGRSVKGLDQIFFSELC